MVIGLKKDQVEVVSYDPIWRNAFILEKYFIEHTLNEVPFVSICHIGSTSVLGLSAKPIIDILIGLNSNTHMIRTINQLDHIGYNYLPELGDKSRRFLGKGDPCIYHVHLVEHNSDQWRRIVTFRNTLRVNQAIRLQYQRLKVRLAELYPVSRLLYLEAKSTFINHVLDNQSSDESH